LDLQQQFAAYRYTEAPGDDHTGADSLSSPYDQQPSDGQYVGNSQFPALPRAPNLAHEPLSNTQLPVASYNNVTLTYADASNGVNTGSPTVEEEDTKQFLNRMVAEGRIPGYSLANISTHPCIVLTQSPGWNAKKLQEHIWDVMLEQDIDNWKHHPYHVMNWSEEADLPFPWNIKLDDRPNPEDFCPDDTTAPPGQSRDKCLTCDKEVRKCIDPRTEGRCTTCQGSKAITKQTNQKKSGQKRFCYWPQPPYLLHHFDTVKLFHLVVSDNGTRKGAWWYLKATQAAIAKLKASKAEAAASRAINIKSNGRKRRREINDRTVEPAAKAARCGNQADAPSSSRSRARDTAQRVPERDAVGPQRPTQPVNAHTDGQTQGTVQQGDALSEQTVDPPLTVPHSALPELQVVNPALISRLPKVTVTENYRQIVVWSEHAHKIGSTQISNHIQAVMDLAGADERLALVLIAKTPSDLELEKVRMLVQQSGWTSQMVLEKLMFSGNNGDMVLAQAALNCGMGDRTSTVYGYLYVPSCVEEEMARLWSMGDTNGVVSGIHAGMTGNQRDTIANAAIVSPIPTQDVLVSVFHAVGMDYWQFPTLADTVPPFVWLQMEYVVQHMAQR